MLLHIRHTAVAQQIPLLYTALLDKHGVQNGLLWVNILQFLSHFSLSCILAWICVFVQLHIITNAVNHKPHSLMTVPAFVYHMEISGQLPTVFTAIFLSAMFLTVVGPLFMCVYHWSGLWRANS